MGERFKHRWSLYDIITDAFQSYSNRSAISCSSSFPDGTIFRVMMSWMSEEVFM
ncbi:hypothetical protein T11_7177 [Trichinella zimbabwensis]|uniref:Uncharacterized protein n=1 Tax=Trichinella zimbabwensis TaxID=268475 RepID=A0A0V1G7I3_9BILA|nr:hypothetical protein T11_7177 [Trichinella zimbabwensis]